MDALRREHALLDWLVAWRPTKPGPVASLAEMFDGEPPASDMDLWLETVQDLDDRGLVKADLVFGVFGSAVRLTGRGRAETEARHRRRDDPAQRARACREALLNWAYGTDSTVQETEFLTSPSAYYEGNTFTAADLTAALGLLDEEGFLTRIGATGDETTPRSRLTARGKRHVESAYGSDWPVHGNQVTVLGDNHGSINVGNRDVTSPVASRRPEQPGAGAQARQEVPSIGSDGLLDIAGDLESPGRWQAQRWDDGRSGAGLAFQSLEHIASPFPLSRYDGSRTTEFRFGWRIACPPISSRFAAKEISNAFLNLLSGPVFLTAVGRLAGITGCTWQRYGDGGRGNYSAVLDRPNEISDPIAWARFNSTPDSPYPVYGRESGCADLMIAVRYLASDRTARLPARLPDWRDTFIAWIEATGTVGCFLAEDLRLALSTQPPTRLGMAVTAKTDLSELVGLSSATQIAGTTLSPWFHAAAAASSDGLLVADVADRWMTALCDDALHLDDHEATRNG